MTDDSDAGSDAPKAMGSPVFDLKKRTKLFALRVIKLYGKLPKQTVAQIIGKQVLRSGMSIGANYREADQGRSRAEFIAKMGDSLREIEETEYWFVAAGRSRDHQTRTHDVTALRSSGTKTHLLHHHPQIQIRGEMRKAQMTNDQ